MWTQNGAWEGGEYPHVVRKASGWENLRCFTFLPSKITIINSFFAFLGGGLCLFLWEIYYLNRWINRQIYLSIYSNRFVDLRYFFLHEFLINFFFSEPPFYSSATQGNLSTLPKLEFHLLWQTDQPLDFSDFQAKS